MRARVFSAWPSSSESSKPLPRCAPRTDDPTPPSRRPLRARRSASFRRMCVPERTRRAILDDGGPRSVGGGSVCGCAVERSRGADRGPERGRSPDRALHPGLAAGNDRQRPGQEEGRGARARARALVARHGIAFFPACAQGRAIPHARGLSCRRRRPGWSRRLHDSVLCPLVHGARRQTPLRSHRGRRRALRQRTMARLGRLGAGDGLVSGVLDVELKAPAFSSPSACRRAGRRARDRW